ncbi:hypothetical protein BGX24_006846 [Mortierella sp. AD032]|nr:hypothetical protein BGX24_006846 [Mortierella sp. AD032]
MSISELLNIPEEAIVGDNLDLMPSASDILAAHMEDENEEEEDEDGNRNASEETPIVKAGVAYQFLNTLRLYDFDEDEDINEQQAVENDFEKEGNAFWNCIKLSPSLSEFNNSYPGNEYEQGLAEAIVEATSSSSSTMTTVSSTAAAAATSMDAVKEPHGHR